MATVTTRYAGFSHDARELSAYGKILDFFTISLRNGSIVHHHPEDAEAFEAWLRHHGVRDISHSNEPW